MQGEADECGDRGLTLGEGAGLFTICRLTDGLWGKLVIGETEGGTEAKTAAGIDVECGIGGGSGGGSGGGGGVVFFRRGDEEGVKDIELFMARPPPLLPPSFGVEKSNNISAASWELVFVDEVDGKGVRVMLAEVIFDSI